MQATITTNIADIIGRWNARGPAAAREQRRAAQQIAPVMLRTSQAVLRKRIYAVPIPRGRTGRPQWRRTGDLIGKERWTAQGAEVVGTNLSDHAEYRLLLGTPYGRPIRSPGVQQVDWQVEAIRERRGWILQIRREAQRRALRGR